MVLPGAGLYYPQGCGDMIFFNKIFVFPVFIRKTSTLYNTRPDFTFRWRKSKMAGTTKTTTYTMDLSLSGKKFQWSCTWRPDVTRYWWKNSKLGFTKTNSEGED